MKRESFDHPKMKTLARTLRVPIYAANGITARLWWFTSQYAPAGDIGRFTDDDITEAVGFDLDRSKELVESLQKAGFIDYSQSHRLVIHDWAEHCEEAVHAKLARRGELFADGSEPNTRLLNALEKERAKQEFQNRRMELEKHAHDMRMSGACDAHEHATTLSLALPLPLPLPEIKDTPLPPQGESATADESVEGELDIPSPKPNTPQPPYSAITDTWNKIASELSLPRCERLSEARRRVIRQRWKSDFWRENYLSALGLIRGSPFLRGENDRGWVANIDWFLRGETVTKLIEGAYSPAVAVKTDDLPF